MQECSRMTYYETVGETSLPVGRQVMQVSEERTKKETRNVQCQDLALIFPTELWRQVLQPIL